MAITNKALARQYEKRAQAERDAGGFCVVTANMPCIELKLSDGSEYFFQGEEAENLLSEVPDWIYPDDYLLAMAQNW